MKRMGFVNASGSKSVLSIICYDSLYLILFITGRDTQLLFLLKRPPKSLPNWYFVARFILRFIPAYYEYYFRC